MKEQPSAVRVKTKPRASEVEKIKGLTSQELTDRCPDLRKTFPTSACTNIDCPWTIASAVYMNCSFVAAEACANASSDNERGLSLEEIGKALNLTREGVRLIQVRAMRKLRVALSNLDQTNGSRALPEQDVVPGQNSIGPGDQITKPTHKDSLVLTGNRRKLG